MSFQYGFSLVCGGVIYNDSVIRRSGCNKFSISGDGHGSDLGFVFYQLVAGAVELGLFSFFKNEGIILDNKGRLFNAEFLQFCKGKIQFFVQIIVESI